MKLMALVVALWSGDAMRVRKEADMLMELAKEAEAFLNEDQEDVEMSAKDKLLELAKKAETFLNEDELVALENQEVAEEKSASGDRRRRRRRRRRSGASSEFPVLTMDLNPIGPP